MIKKEWIKKILPFVAVLVILESVLLVMSLNKNKQQHQINVEVDTQEQVTKKDESKLSLFFVENSKEMQIGKKYKVTLVLQSKEDLNISGTEIFIKFDPNMVTITNLVSNSELDKPEFIKVSEKKNVLVSTILSRSKDGMKFIKDSKVNLLSFDITPIKEGKTVLEIGTGDSDGNSVTMVVDKVTNRAIPFVSNELDIKLVK